MQFHLIVIQSQKYQCLVMVVFFYIGMVQQTRKECYEAL